MYAGFRPEFQFYNSISPRYIEPLFLQLEYGRWYDIGQLKGLLQANGLDVEGSSIVLYNIMAWSLAGLGHSDIVKTGRSKMRRFQFTPLGKQVIDIYSMNRELFYDLMHFIFYSTWPRSLDIRRARFWVYNRVCETLWLEAPAQMDSFSLTSRLQSESREAFPDYEPAFPERSVRAVFPWLQVLNPPFLYKRGKVSQLDSRRRSYCTPQLFHLATDLVYTADGLKYGTSMAVDERHIEAICRTCLLNTANFWQMADLTKMTIRGYDIRKGQWNTSIALEGPPTWIDLPDFKSSDLDSNLDGGDE